MPKLGARSAMTEVSGSSKQHRAISFNKVIAANAASRIKIYRLQKVDLY